MIRREFLQNSLLMVSAAPSVLAQAPPALRIGTTTGDSYAGALYCQDKGFFSDAGLDVELTILASGSAIVAGVVGGAVDVGVTNPVSFATAAARGIPVRYIASGGLYNPNETSLLVSDVVTVRGGKDLEGKPIATTSLVDINTLGTRAWVDQHGGDSTKLLFVEMPYSSMAPALRKGTVIAAAFIEPALTTVLKEGGVRRLEPPFLSVFGRRFLVGGWFAQTAWIDANRALARRFVDTLYTGARWANTHPAESATILAKYSHLDPTVVQSMNRAPYGTTLVPAQLQPVFDACYRYRVVEQPLNAASVIEIV